MPSPGLDRADELSSRPAEDMDLSTSSGETCREPSGRDAVDTWGCDHRPPCLRAAPGTDPEPGLGSCLVDTRPQALCLPHPRSFPGGDKQGERQGPMQSSDLHRANRCQPLSLEAWLQYQAASPWPGCCPQWTQGPSPPPRLAEHLQEGGWGADPTRPGCPQSPLGSREAGDDVRFWGQTDPLLTAQLPVTGTEQGA